MLYIEYPSLVFTPLFHFVLPVASCCCWFVVEGCNGIETRTSKKVLLLLLFQNSWALMSSLALFWTFVLLKENLSPVKGWRVGSMATLGQTSMRSWAVISLMRSCRIDGRAPLGQLKAWLTEKATPHEQWEGSLAGHQPHMMQGESILGNGCLPLTCLIHGNLLWWWLLLLYSLGFLSSSYAMPSWLGTGLLGSDLGSWCSAGEWLRQGALSLSWMLQITERQWHALLFQGLQISLEETAGPSPCHWELASL